MAEDDPIDAVKKALENWGEGPRIGIGFTDPNNPVKCDNCEETVIAKAEAFEDQFYKTKFHLTHQCPRCRARGIIVTTDGIPVLRHPRLI
ncbi:MAG: hypothetical protein WAX80_00360 [Minisyncoccia bacterium]